jgi:hypothetical protein
MAYGKYGEMLLTLSKASKASLAKTGTRLLAHGVNHLMARNGNMTLTWYTSGSNKKVEKNQRPAYAKQLIERLNYLTLATADRDGQPWNSPVFYAYDGKKTFYWGYRHNTQHFTKHIGKRTWIYCNL